MIFATVGTQLPFPRLLQALDKLAERHNLDVFAQSADPTAELRNINAKEHLPPSEFQQHVDQADLIVGHAGIGTVLTALRAEKPLIVLPRRAALDEHRNEHQMATARALKQTPGIYIAWTEVDLEHFITRSSLQAGAMMDSPRRDDLIQHLRLHLQH